MFTKQAVEIAHTLSDPSKMPGKSYSLPTHACPTGSTLREIEGSVCSKCYADNRGNYRFNNVKKALEKRLSAITHPNWVEAMASLIQSEEWFRWHDSGDIQSIEHFDRIASIAKDLPQTNFWIPTKERGIITKWKDKNEEWPKNLSVRWSMPMIEQMPTKSAIALEGQMNYSMVTKHSKGDWEVGDYLNGYKKEDFFYCEAKSRDNQCGHCRACWDTDLRVIMYPYH